MQMNITEASSPSSANASTSSIEDQFYAIIERLKAQKILPQDSFVKELPFFNLNALSKESQLKELFQDTSDSNLYKTLMINMTALPEGNNPQLLAKRLSAMQVMGFAQIVLYKVLPCPEKECPNCPREIAPRNQYKDYEYSCPFYHHDKDKRRLVITSKIEDEFIYKANYLMEGKHAPVEDPEKHSVNYFESLFHPLYYKLFRCKRTYCNFSQFCPFFHSEEERKTWDNMFSNFIRKDRVSYVKDKQKFYQATAPKRYSKPVKPENSPDDNVNERNQQNKSAYKPRNSNDYEKVDGSNSKRNDWRNEKRAGAYSSKPETNKTRNNRNRKNYGDYLNQDSPTKNSERFVSRELINNRVC